MPWVRLDENAMEHPKIGGLSDGAFRLWVQGLAYCQKFLTDGWIASVALRGLRAYSAKRTMALVDSGLWHTGTDGVQVHDYLDWNESKERVLEQRRCSRERMANMRRTSREVRNPPTPHHTTPPLRSDKPNGEPPTRTSARSKRPIFSGQRFVVFDWMLDDLRKLLGTKNLEAFDLHEWFFTLDARAEASGLIIPQRDGGKWLQEQTLEEASRRGMVVAAVQPGTGRTAGNAAAIARFIARGQE